MYYKNVCLPVLFLCIVITSALLVSGCGGGGGGSAITISSAGAVPSELPTYEGGDVTISADVTATAGVKSVQATVTKPDGTQDPNPVVMTLLSGSTYTGTYTAPANEREDRQAVTYTVIITATDNNDLSDTSSQFSFIVPGAPPWITISNPQVTPTQLPSYIGGTVTIQAQVSAVKGVGGVYATVTMPGGSTAPTVSMDAYTGGVYRGEYIAPENFDEENSAIYRVIITALDSEGRSATSSELTFIVPAASIEPPPPPPPPG